LAAQIFTRIAFTELRVVFVAIVERFAVCVAITTVIAFVLFAGEGIQTHPIIEVDILAFGKQALVVFRFVETHFEAVVEGIELFIEYIFVTFLALFAFGVAHVRDADRTASAIAATCKNKCNNRENRKRYQRLLSDMRSLRFFVWESSRRKCQLPVRSIGMIPHFLLHERLKT